jgi:hypothetical protein
MHDKTEYGQQETFSHKQKRPPKEPLLILVRLSYVLLYRLNRADRNQRARWRLE